MTVYREGNRRCDARCYDSMFEHAAKGGARCRCVCGGKNHGVGLDEAKRRSRALVESMKDLALFAGE